MSLIKLTITHEGKTYDLWREGLDGVPRAKDLDVARWLGFARPRKVRELIERHRDSLGEVLRPTVGRNPGTVGRPEEPYYLTREQVAFIAAKSETPRAVEFLKAIITVFFMVADGRGVSQAELKALGEVKTLLLQAQAARGRLEGEVNALRRQLASGVIGDEVAEATVKSIIRQIALYESLDRDRNLGHWRKKCEERVRRNIKHHRRWGLLPREKLGDTEGLLDDLLREAKAAAARRNVLKQTEMDLH